MDTPLATVVIPARLGSTRLPRKALLDLGGKPILQHVWERAKRMRCARAVVVATDSEEIARVAADFGADARLTSPECRNGTERIVELLPKLEGNLFLNVQGDEPFIEPQLLDGLVERMAQTGCDLVTAVRRLKDPKQIADPNLVKVVRARDGHAIYFSRSPVPHLRGVPPENWTERRAYWGHIGVYGYTRGALEAYPEIGEGYAEQSEKLEQLRFLERNLAFQTVETDYRAVGIDTAEDLEAARKLLSNA